MKKLILVLAMLPSLCLADKWQCINHQPMSINCNTWRWEVPGGWLVSTDNGDQDIAMTFYPDSQHEWKI